MTVVTRFAPSPTGYLHLGHAYSALFAYRLATASGGDFVLRIEDIDQGRKRPEFEQAIYEDLEWLGVEWQQPIRRQSDHIADYQAALDRLDAAGLLYPCFCTRKEIRAEIERAGQAPHLTQDPDGQTIYPGTCRGLSVDQRVARIAAGDGHAMRLDVDAAIDHVAGPLAWEDQIRGPQPALPERFGDVVLARKDIGASYHIAVTVDDAEQGVSIVTRAEDLFSATHIHRLLQALLDLPTPSWQHHPVVTDEAGQRLAKRDAALTIRELRAAGHPPERIRALANTTAARSRPMLA